MKKQVGFYCGRCKTEIIDMISTKHKNVCFRRDLIINNHRCNLNPILVESDREYFNAEIVSIFFSCPRCGCIEITHDECMLIYLFQGIGKSTLEIQNNINFTRAYRNKDIYEGQDINFANKLIMKFCSNPLQGGQIMKINDDNN